MRDFFAFFLNNSFAVAQNTGAQNAQTQKSNLEAQSQQEQNASTDQAAVGGIDISAADNTALASSGDITLLAE